MLNDEPIRVTLLVADALEKLGIKYVIGGSLASALHGVARATMDTAIVADLHDEHVDALVEALKSTFYVDDEMIREAIQAHRSFNSLSSQNRVPTSPAPRTPSWQNWSGIRLVARFPTGSGVIFWV